MYHNIHQTVSLVGRIHNQDVSYFPSEIDSSRKSLFPSGELLIKHFCYALKETKATYKKNNFTL